MGGVKEMANSSLSISTKGSRIPRLRRSNSLREKPQRISLSETIEFQNCAESRQSSVKKLPNIGGLFRSSSFVTSRGMKDYPGGVIEERFTAPSTPEMKKKFSPYVSPYSMRAITAERKLHAQLASARDREIHTYFSPQVMRRTSAPHMTSTYGNYHHSKGDTTPEDDEDACSEKSFGSICSTHSCDRSKMWSSDRPHRNVLHCSYGHDRDVDDYLTPTQRSARKIRELQAQLKKARREIFEGDSGMSMLTRELVELHMNKTEKDGIDKSNDTNRREPKKTANKEGDRGRTSPKNGCTSLNDLSPCLTPNSETSERERNLSTDENNCSSTYNKRRNAEPNSRNSPVGEDSDSGNLNPSLADSGHYDDLPSPGLSSRVSHDEDSLDSGIPSIRKIVNSICTSGEGRDSTMVWAAVTAAEEGIKADWSRKMEELKANHMEEYHEMKERHNDKVEMLLSKLSDANLKYFELRPKHDEAQEKIRKLEKEIERLEDNLRENEIRHQKVYLQMYLKGQEAAKLNDDKNYESNNSKEDRRKVPCNDSSGVDSQNSVIVSLMKQLAQSEEEIEKLKKARCLEAKNTGKGSNLRNRREEIDPEITLQFLKSAIYYFLTDRENAQGHLRAIESILDYSSKERGNISRSLRI